MNTHTHTVNTPGAVGSGQWAANVYFEEHLKDEKEELGRISKLLINN